jgi:hypothetical protein
MNRKPNEALRIAFIRLLQASLFVEGKRELAVGSFLYRVERSPGGTGVGLWRVAVSGSGRPRACRQQSCPSLRAGLILQRRLIARRSISDEAWTPARTSKKTTVHTRSASCRRATATGARIYIEDCFRGDPRMTRLRHVNRIREFQESYTEPNLIHQQELCEARVSSIISSGARCRTGFPRPLGW